MTLDRAKALALDAADPLASCRDAFHMPRTASGERVYLCGHSLGLQPKSVSGYVSEELESWARLGVDGHFETQRPWLPYHERLSESLARLCGAMPAEVVAMNSLTVNLHLLLASFYRPTRERHRILIEKRAFSSDRYAVASQLRWHGFEPARALLEIGPRPGEATLRTSDVCEVIEREHRSIAAIVWPGVQYLTGQRFDLAAIAGCARAHGCTIGFDLAHAIGNVPLALHDSDADFAVWCGYKYLNGGPGAIGGAFVHERHARAFDLPRLAGWWGHDKGSRFDMPDAFNALSGAEGWQVSNPPILAAAPLLASLELFDRVGLDALRAKSVKLTACLEALLASELADAIEILTPAAPDERGCQLSLRLARPAERARAVHQALTAEGFICDWREPDVIRVAPVPFYNRFADVFDFVAALRRHVS